MNISNICIVQVENEYGDLKRRVELETNELRDKMQVGLLINLQEIHFTICFSV